MTNIDSVIYGQPAKTEVDEMMINVAKRALEVAIEEAKYKAAKEALNAACRKFRRDNDITNHIKRDSGEWVDMMNAASREVATKLYLKRQISNAKRRLKTSIDRMARGNFNLGHHLLPSFHHDHLETYQALAADLEVKWETHHSNAHEPSEATDDPSISGHS
jgi:membrane-associated HD superfamily phosphohydrolase